MKGLRFVGMTFAALGFATGAWCQLHDVQIPILPTARTEKTEWKYVNIDPGSGWYASEFADADWTLGLAGFGTRITPHAVISTEWSSDNIWMRKTFTAHHPEAMGFVALDIHHDEEAEVYLNGVLVWQDTGFTTDYITVLLSDSAKAVLKDGENLIAIHCHQTIRGQYIDVGLFEVKSVELASLLPLNRIDPQEWKWSIDDPGTSNWNTLNYAADGWTSSFGAFGSENTPGGSLSTSWLTPDIWIRKTITLPETGFSDFLLTVFHDEDVEVFINGRLALQNSSYLKADLELIVSDTVKAGLRPGVNIIAAHCHQTAGGQFLDVGLSGIPMPTVGIMRSGIKGNPSAIRSAGFQVWNRFYDLSGRQMREQPAKHIPLR
jgi:hypothetical protein